MNTSVLRSDWDSTQTTIETLDLLPYEGKKKFAIVLHNICTPQECQDFIRISEENGYEQALVNVGGGRQCSMTDIRNNDRSIIDDPVTAEILWQRILLACQHDTNLLHAPWVGTGLFAVGINERLRFLRYDPGTYFTQHYDGSYRRGNEAGESRCGETSYVTMQLYLNEGFEGGATSFSKFGRATSPNRLDVIPRTGSVLLFEHQCSHEGAVLISGRKYAIRSDVMYTTKGDQETYALNPISLNKVLEPPPLEKKKSVRLTPKSQIQMMMGAQYPRS